jgi:cell division septation protein DedD
MESETSQKHVDDTSKMAQPDTEITLGTGKMLVLFFGLVALCSAFFGLGYKLGRGSGGGELTSSPSTTAPVKSPLIKPATNPATAVPPAQTSTPDGSASTTPPADNTNKPADAGTSTQAPTDATPVAPSNYYVQVAAVTKQEDADALVDALKKKQYAAFAMTMADKLIHVQVGPFTDIKDAESTRAKLVNDGYNPILKK